jgi:competence protein ComGF
MRADKIKAVYPVTKLATSNSASFKCIDQKGDATTYRIEYYKKNVLKVSGAGKGYMPLLFNVEKATFKTTKDSIIIRVTEKNKGASDLVFQLDEEQEKKNAKTKEKDA